MQVCLGGCWVGKGSASLGCGVWKCWAGDTGKGLHWNHISCWAGLTPVPATQAPAVANPWGATMARSSGADPQQGWQGTRGSPRLCRRAISASTGPQGCRQSHQDPACPRSRVTAGVTAGLTYVGSHFRQLCSHPGLGSLAHRLRERKLACPAVPSSAATASPWGSQL